MFATPLKGLRILDLTQMIAGPYCTRLMGIYGAEVIKIERPALGDAARRSNPSSGAVEDPETSPAFLYLNTGKKSITLNLKSEQGREVFLKLLSSVDMVVENFRPGVMQRLGLDYTTLIARNARVVMVSISNFGQTGPYKDYAATELNLQAWSGLMHMAGDRKREPLRLGFSAAQYEAGQNAFAAALAALLARPSLDGQHVDIAIMDTVMTGLNSIQAHYSYNQEVQGRKGGRGSDIQQASDGYVIARMPHGKSDMERLSKIVGEPLSTDNLEHATQVFRHWVAAHTKAEVMNAGQAAQFAWGALNDAHEILQAPHIAERKFLQRVTHPVVGELPYPTAPFRMGEGEPALTPAPTLGQHNREILCDSLGYTNEQLLAWQHEGVV